MSPTTHAAGEKYTWWNSNTITASGGRYTTPATLTASQPYTPGKDNVPQFRLASNSFPTDTTGCQVYPSLSFSGKDTAKATVTMELGVTFSDCSSDITKLYDKTATLAGSSTGSTAEVKFDLRVISLVSEGNFPATSDTITIKTADDEKQVASKGATKKYSADGDKGFEATFNNLKANTAYIACSKALNVCSESYKYEGDGTNILDELGKTIRIVKDPASDTTCAIDGIGWIVCPVMTFLGTLNDLAFGFLNNFLEVRPAVFNDAATRLAWSSFRNIANVAFVIAFLVIIYSQITGGGMSNYGLKKLLPKLIIAAILVNISFWVCAVLIDLSNIAGSSLYSLLTGFNIGDDGGGGGTMSSIWSVAVAGLLGATIGIGLLALIIFAPMSLLAFAVVILILIARQALVILLIVISPLAFVAYLLPNTENWFKKWWKALTGTLMVYPIIALVFGASTLASSILMRVAEDGVGGGDDVQMLKIIAAAVLALPLFAIPSLLKGSMAAAGTIGAKLSGLQDKASGRAGRAVKEGRLGEAKTAFDTRRRERQVNRRLGKGRLATWGQDREDKGKRGGTALKWAGSRGAALDKTRPGRYLGGDRGAAAAVVARQKMEGEAVENSVALLQDGDVATVITNAKAQLRRAHDTGDATAARAATRVLASKTGARGVEELHKTIRGLETGSTTGKLSDSVSSEVRYEVTAAGLKGTDRALDKWSRLEPGDKDPVTGESLPVHTLTGHDTAGATPSGLNEAELAGQSLDSLRHFAASGTLDVDTAGRVLAAHVAGTIHLDKNKLDVFNQAKNSTAAAQTDWIRSEKI